MGSHVHDINFNRRKREAENLEKVDKHACASSCLLTGMMYKLNTL